MPRYRKKPIVVEAFQWDNKGATWPEWLEAAARKRPSTVGSFNCANGLVTILTLEGVMRVDPDDYIIQGVQGELYPCKPDIFEATYEAVGEGNEPLFHDLGPVRPMPRLEGGDEGPAASFTAALDSPAIQAACRSMWSGIDWDAVFAECTPLEGEG